MGRPDRALPVRRIRVQYPPGSLRQHYVEDDLIMSHVVAVLSATFPPGEDSPTAVSTASSTGGSRTWATPPTG